ncbi:hypothetical protein UAW_02673 [Enterococcus haemoperoxidus ATCC BAA-382]|uniref:Uncharacterized protein n=1 Tax=Enterococcus haemoperoxidus ATCC BAA-382 TaxID=1158608 RepID=R2SZI6_9ENTE|nr:hypothetical protein [Enterococcus haemoperoxidus]EOH93424.1 hypothetical protein UAW_02673 [Enterococcus haemoperoxidus ATCC BAA-382]EOT61378.1 hypothetical protein I583_00357 [Enterococcus haemoperoxidus ATCC BAA-382]OJG54561.1 hypothetical protein RV06_GL002904 [Enterococcus haemoperoxidus]
MEITEDEYIGLTSTEGIHQDDVAMLIDNNDTLEELVSDLKEYFKSDAKYYEDRKVFKTAVDQAMAAEAIN